MNAPAAIAFGVALAQASTPQAAAPQVRLRERVDVERVLLEARVVDGFGEPVPGLRPEHFRVAIGHEDVRVESVYWVTGADPAPPPGVTIGRPAGPAPGRLVVFFFQKDLERSRIGGLLRMTREAALLADRLAPGDRAAVLSFDSRLKLWQDFTDDRAALRRAIQHSILFGETPARSDAAEDEAPTLAPYFDLVRARRAATPETALLVLADALKPLPGSKSLVFVGWGLGRFSAAGVHMERDYGPARLALVEARTAVFTLDVTDADYHSLEVGLEQVAEDTGGFYAKTHLFTGQALRRLQGALAGHYVLVVEKPLRGAPPQPVRIRLVGRRGTVLARPTWEG